MTGTPWIAVLTATSGLVLLGCSHSPSPVTQGNGASQPDNVPITAENHAIQRFHAMRGTVGFPADPEERLMAHRDSLKNCLARVKSTLQPRELKACIVFGELSSLDREGDCWVVEVDQGLLGGQVAYFDEMGQLVFAWRAPEG